MRQAYEVPIENDPLFKSTKAYEESPVDTYVSDVDGFSREELISFATDLDMLLSPIMDSYANTIVICERLGGAEMTLSQAVNAIWPVSEKGAMAKEGLQSVMAEIQKMLASRPAETNIAEEETEDKEPDQVAEVEEQSETLEAEQAPAEKDKPQEDVNQKNDSRAEANKVQVETSNENKLAKPQAPVVGKVKNQPQPIDSKVTVVKPMEQPAPAKSQQGQPTPAASKARAAAKIDAKPAEITQPDNIGIAEIPAVAAAAPAIPAAETAFSSASQQRASRQSMPEAPAQALMVVVAPEAGSAQQVPPVEQLHADIAEPFAAEDKVSDTVPEFTEGQEVETFDTPVAPEIDTEPDLIEQLQLGIENAPTSNYAEITGEAVEVPEEGLAAEPVGVQLGSISLSELIATEILAHDDDDEDVPGAEEQSAIMPSVSAENSPSQKEDEVDCVEVLAPASLPIKEVDGILVQLAERSEEIESEEADTVHKILVKITAAATKLEAQAGEDAAETEAQEELKELVIELLEKAGIEYAPELVESLPSFTLWQHLSKEIKKSKDETEEDGAPHDTGTNESIMHLLLGFSKIKKIMERASAIGKSALRLSFKLT